MTQSIPKIPKVFSMPAASPRFAPPPYQTKGNRIATIFFKTTPEAIHRLVPAPLQPNPDQIIGVYYVLFTVPPPVQFSYKEAGIFVPGAHGETQGMYCAYMFLDTATAIMLGREVYGFPKKEANITLTEEDGQFSTVVSSFGFPLIKASMRLEKRVEVIPESPYGVFFNLKVIPSIKKGAPPDVFQLTSTPNSTQTTELYVGPGSLELGAPPFEPLGSNIPIIEITNAKFEVQDQTLDYGDVVVDYLTK